MRLDSEHDAQAAGTDAARAQLAAAEADLREAVQTQFLRYFEAQAIGQIADTSEHELGDEVEVARARLASGVITRADMLRIEVAVANAHQQALQARSQAQVARATLLALIGTGVADAGVTLLEPRNLLAAARTPPARLDALLPQARARRPELVERLRLVDAADQRAHASGYSLLPEINAEAAYLRTDGQVFAPKNSAFVGVRAEWAIWEWGATEHLRRAAGADAQAARRDLEATERQVESDLSISLAQGDAARGAVDAAEKAIASAEEAFRVTERAGQGRRGDNHRSARSSVGADPGAAQPHARAVRARALARRRRPRLRRVSWPRPDRRRAQRCGVTPVPAWPAPACSIARDLVDVPVVVPIGAAACSEAAHTASTSPRPQVPA